MKNTNRIAKIFFFSIIILLIITCFGLVNINVYASISPDDIYTGYSSTLDRNTLKEKTTTTNFTTVDYENNNFVYSRTTEMVDDSEPLLTVPVPGYGSEASVWSNSFEYFLKTDFVKSEGEDEDKKQERKRKKVFA